MVINKIAMEELHIANENIKDNIKNFYSNVTEFLGGNVRSLVSKVQYVLKSFSSDDLPNIDISSLTDKEKEFFKIISEIPYSELMYIKVPSIEKLNVNLITLLNTLSDPIDRCKKLEDELNEYNKLLGELISNENSRKSMNLNENKYIKMENDRDEIYSKIKTMYTGNESDQRVIGQLVDRNADWKEVFNKTKDVLKTLESIDKKQIDKSIIVATKLTDEIINLNLSIECMRKLSNSTYQLAKELELYSYLYYQVLTVQGKIENSVDKITDIYKK